MDEWIRRIYRWSSLYTNIHNTHTNKHHQTYSGEPAAIAAANPPSVEEKAVDSCEIKAG